jgi:hypothetical protein
VEPIGRDDVVAAKGGHIVTTAALQSLPERLQNSDIQITDDLHLVALTDDELRDIEAGEELTTDCALFDDYEGSME